MAPRDFTIDCVALDARMSCECAGHATTDEKWGAPRAFRLFKPGANESVKGVFTWDSIAAKAVMERFARLGRRCTIDYEHASLRKDAIDPAEAGKSAGDFVLAIRQTDDGPELWAEDVIWSVPGKRRIENREFVYFSPAFAKETGKDGKTRPTWLINAAATNNPALFGIPTLQETAAAESKTANLAKPVKASALLDEWLAPVQRYAEIVYASTIFDDLPDPSSLTAPADDATALAASRPPLTSAPVKPADDRAAAASNPDTRREMARKAAAAWAVNNLGVNGPVGLAPDHPAATAPLTFQYPNPAAAGWLGCIEPDADTWIAFVTPAGKTALWDRRNDDGSVAGAPMLFQRDIATLLPDDEDAAKASLAASVLAMTALHADLASAASDYVDACLDAELAALGVA